MFTKAAVLLLISGQGSLGRRLPPLDAPLQNPGEDPAIFTKIFIKDLLIP